MQKFTGTCIETPPTKVQDEIAVTAPISVNLKLHGQEITRLCWKSFTFHICIHFMHMFDARSPTLNKGREGTRRERCYLSFHTQGDLKLHFPPPCSQHSSPEAFSRGKRCYKKKMRVRRTIDCRFEIDAKRVLKIWELHWDFPLPKQLSYKTPPSWWKIFRQVFKWLLCHSTCSTPQRGPLRGGVTD